MDFWQKRNEQMFCDIMTKQGFIKEVRDHGAVWVKPKVKIKFLEGRPNRDTVINKHDITNLKIQLNICRTIEEFINSI